VLLVARLAFAPSHSQKAARVAAAGGGAAA